MICSGLLNELIIFIHRSKTSVWIYSAFKRKDVTISLRHISSQAIVDYRSNFYKRVLNPICNLSPEVLNIATCIVVPRFG